MKHHIHLHSYWNSLCFTGWHHQMETFSTLLALCAGNSPVTGEFLAQRPVTRSFYVFFDLRMNKRLSKQSWGWWFEMPSCSLWHHCNVSESFLASEFVIVSVQDLHIYFKLNLHFHGMKLKKKIRKQHSWFCLFEPFQNRCGSQHRTGHSLKLKDRGIISVFLWDISCNV